MACAEGGRESGDSDQCGGRADQRGGSFGGRKGGAGGGAELEFRDEIAQFFFEKIGVLDISHLKVDMIQKKREER